MVKSIDEIFKGNLGIEVTLEAAKSDRVRELNREYRDRDNNTDVLSFPGFFEVEMQNASSVYSPFNEEFQEKAEKSGVSLPFLAKDQVPPVLFLGEIVLDHDYALNWAERNDVDVKRHLALLVVHSLLHLLGVDHDTDENAEGMESVERYILKKTFPE
jgi:probable rRNA maturation factor